MAVDGRGGRTRVRGLRALAIIGLLSAAVLLGGCGSHAPATPPRRVSVSTVTVTAKPVGRAITPGFLGLSFEYPAVAFYTGPDPRKPNPVLVQLIRNLTPGQSPVLRIGGDSTDTSWIPVAGMAKPRWVKYTLTQRWISTTRALAGALRARLILGVNLEADSTPIAAAEANAFATGIGTPYIEALELGNEPEAYGSLAWYDDGTGRPVFGRPSWYGTIGLSSYVDDFSRIRTVLPDLPLAGPATGGMRQLAHVGQLVAAEPQLRLVTFHRYPLNRCFASADSPQPVSLADLLTMRASRGLVKGLAPYVAMAHSHGLGFRIDETNSVACGGKLGLSDTFASALWVLDAMFSMARAGVDGVNIHTFPGARYSLFLFNHSNVPRRALVHPEYYGLLMFARAAPRGSRLLALRSARSPDLRAWATLSADGTRRVVLINDSIGHARWVRLRLGARPGAVSLERLAAPSIRSSLGIKIGGQSFGPSTGSGTLPGKPRLESLAPVRGGYYVRLAAASAALIVIAASR